MPADFHINFFLFVSDFRQNQNVSTKCIGSLYMKFQENPASGVALSYSEGRKERRDEANMTLFT